MKKVLLTGHTGFLGKIIIKNLEEKYIITTLGKSSPTPNHIYFDLKNPAPIKLNYCFDIIIHSAGKAHIVPKNEKERNEFHEINFYGTKRFLDSLDSLPLKPKSFIFVSTVAVYGLDFGENISEDSPLNAKDAYGISKKLSEDLISEWCKTNNVICTILRLPLVIGFPAKGNLDKMIKGIKNGFYFNIGGGKARKSMVMGEDVADFIPLVESIGGIYNLTDGYNPSFFEFSKCISNQIGKKTPYNISRKLMFVIAKIGDMSFGLSPFNFDKYKKLTQSLTFDDMKARKLAKWSPKFVLESFKLN
jgi:nucleoside-diphosphate-sugar epimerase